MADAKILSSSKKKDTNILVSFFYIWTFVLIARPQDFIEAITPLRPALSVGLVVLILFSFYYTCYKHRLLDNQQCRLYLYLLAVMMISIPFAYYRRGAFEFVFTKYIVTVLFLFLFYKIIDDGRKITNIIWVACLGTSLYLVSALYRGEMGSGRLKFGDMFDPNDLAFFALSFLPFNILYISRNDPWWKRLVSLMNITVSILIVLMTGSRGGFIALGVVVLMLFLTRSEIIGKSDKMIVVIFAVVAIVYGGSTIDFSRFQTMTQIGEDYNVFDETGRIEIWKRGLGLMLSDPLTGVGVSCFSEAIGQQRKELGLQELWQAPHNSLIQIGTETGIFGLILFLLISYKTFKIFGSMKNKGTDAQMIKIGEMAKVGFAGHFTASMFLSQAYSIYWVFFVAVSAVLFHIGSESIHPA
jgi:O-antigen ligase